MEHVTFHMTSRVLPLHTACLIISWSHKITPTWTYQMSAWCWFNWGSFDLLVSGVQWCVDKTYGTAHVFCRGSCVQTPSHCFFNQHHTHFTLKHQQVYTDSPYLHLPNENTWDAARSVYAKKYRHRHHAPPAIGPVLHSQNYLLRNLSLLGLFCIASCLERQNQYGTMAFTSFSFMDKGKRSSFTRDQWGGKS